MLFSFLFRLSFRLYIERDTDCIRCACKKNVILGNRANTAMDDLHVDLFMPKLVEHAFNCFYRTLDVCFDNQV